MLNKLLEVYGDMLIDELGEEIEKTGSYDASQYNPENGSVMGLVYYEDTEVIGKELTNEFFDVVDEYFNSCNQLKEVINGNFNNFVAWFFWELLLSSYKEEVIEYVKTNI